MFKQKIMHLPKLALNTSRFGCFSRVRRMRMRIGRGEVSKGETETTREALLNFFNDQARIPAENAFVVPVLQEGNWRIGRPLQVISGRLRQPVL